MPEHIVVRLFSLRWVRKTKLFQVLEICTQKTFVDRGLFVLYWSRLQDDCLGVPVFVDLYAGIDTVKSITF